MIKNWLIYLGIAAALFVFSAFHSFERTTWNFFLTFAAVPLVSLTASLPFMIYAAAKGITAEAPPELEPGAPAEIKIHSAKRGSAVFPQFKVKVICENGFAGTKTKYPGVVFFGSSKKPFIIINNKLSAHCGTVQISLKRCAVYDFAGMFFIPLRFRGALSVNVMPRKVKPSAVPFRGSSRVLGFKPKPGGGFSDYYELRLYRDGDSIKNVHWKVSSKYDELIVREPSLPVLRELVIRLDLTEIPGQNDSILSRFVYTAEALAAEGREFYCLCGRCGCRKISNTDDIKNCVIQIYRSNAVPGFSVSNAELFVINADGEEVYGA